MVSIVYFIIQSLIDFKFIKVNALIFIIRLQVNAAAFPEYLFTSAHSCRTPAALLPHHLLDATGTKPSWSAGPLGFKPLNIGGCWQEAVGKSVFRMMFLMEKQGKEEFNDNVAEEGKKDKWGRRRRTRSKEEEKKSWDE